jgi:hypothetical protein
MNPPLTPPMPEHLPGKEIPAKHKEAMRQLFKFGKNWPNATPRVLSLRSLILYLLAPWHF